jgi:hypothetical protein
LRIWLGHVILHAPKFQITGNWGTIARITHIAALRWDPVARPSPPATRQHAARAGERHGFHQELADDIAAARPQRLAHADLTSPLGLNVSPGERDLTRPKIFGDSGITQGD